MFYNGSRGKATKPLVNDGSRAGLIPAASKPTMWLRPQYTQTVTVDSANGISQINDVSGNNNHATQANSSFRPILTRSDNKENLIEYSEDISQSTYWGTTAATVSSSDTFFETTANSGHSVGNGVTVIIGKAYVWEVEVQSIGGRNVQLGNNNGGVAYNLTTLALISADSGFFNTSITDMGGSWYRVRWTHVTAQTSQAIFVYSMSGTSVDFVGDVTKGLKVRKAAVRSATADSAYIQTTAGQIVAGTQGNAVMQFDGVDDTLGTTLAVNPTGGMWGVLYYKANVIAADSRWLWAFDGGAGSRFIFRHGASGQIELNIYSSAAVYISRTAPNGTIIAGESCVISFTYDGTTNATGIKIYKNGVQVDNASATAGVYAVPTAGAVLNIATTALNGQIGEVRYGQGSVLRDATRQAYERQLMQQYVPSYIAFDPAINISPASGPVSTWVSTTNTYIASQGTAASQPTVTTIAGQPALLFDGSNDSLATNIAANPTGGMWGMVVVKFNSTGVSHQILNANAGGLTARFILTAYSGGQLNLRIYNGTANYITRLSTGGDFAAGETFIFSFTYDGTTNATGIKLFKNGTQVDTITQTSGAYTVPTAGDNIVIGVLNGIQYVNGYIGDIQYGQGSQISPSALANKITILKAKYGIA